MDLIQAVQDNAGIDAARAEDAIVAVLRLVGGRVSGGLAEELAGQLPEPAARALRMRDDDLAEVGDSRTLARGVSEQLGGDETEGLNLVQGVFRALESSVDEDTVDRLRDQLPLDLANLLAHR